MNQIKSLADELREKIKKDGNPEQVNKETAPQLKNDKAGKKSIDKLFDDILASEPLGNEKLLIRLNDKTIFLLKQLKIAKSIDMNKFIAYSLQDFLNRHPEIILYVKQNIKTIEL